MENKSIVTPEYWDEHREEFTRRGVRVGDLVPAPEEKQKFYLHLAIVSDGYRTVEDRTYHHIKCEDGASYDLTDKMYDETVSFIRRKKDN